MTSATVTSEAHPKILNPLISESPKILPAFPICRHKYTAAGTRLTTNSYPVRPLSGRHLSQLSPHICRSFAGCGPSSLPGCARLQLFLLDGGVPLPRRFHDPGIDHLPAHGQIAGRTQMRVKPGEQGVDRLGPGEPFPARFRSSTPPVGNCLVWRRLRGRCRGGRCATIRPPAYAGINRPVDKSAAWRNPERKRPSRTQIRAIWEQQACRSASGFKLSNSTKPA